MACMVGESNSFSISTPHRSGSVSSISFDGSFASMFGASCSSLCHSRWESAGEGESNNNNSSKNLPSMIGGTQPKPAAMLRIPRGQNIKNAITRASSITSLFGGESSDGGSDPSKRTAVSFPPRPAMMKFKQSMSRRRLMMRAASEKSLLAGKSNHTFADSGLGAASNHTFASSMGSSCTSLLSTWDSVGEESFEDDDDDDSISSFCSSATTVVTLSSEKGGEVKRRHSIGDTSILSSSRHDMLMKQPSPPSVPLPVCTSTSTTVEVKQDDDNDQNLQHNASSSSKNQDRLFAMRKSSSLAPPRLPSRMLSRRNISMK